ncbi:MAG: hypothetical protein ACHQHO_01325 [Solirubrobacterales bacterium]
MDGPSLRFQLATRASMRALAALVCVTVLLLGAAGTEAGAQGAPSGGAGAQPLAPPAAGGVSATLEECVTAAVQEQRAVAFSGEMTAVPGTTRMAMRVDLEERAPGEAEFHTVTAAGLGVWRSSDAKVKVFKYLKQVTNLSAPASYRGFVRFRWFNSKGHVIKRADRLTSRCLQPGAPVEPTETRPGSGAGTTNTGATTPAA